MLHREAVCLLILQKSHHLQSICTVCCDWKWRLLFFYGWWWRWGGLYFCLFSILCTDTSNIYGQFCLRLFFCEKLSLSLGVLHAGRLSWPVLGRGASTTGPLNMTCSMDTTNGLLFSLCNWADNVPWFPLFCTSICSAWAVRCVLSSWKWSGVSKRPGYPPTPPPPPASPVVQMSLWPCHRSEARVHQASSSSPIPEVCVKASNMPEPIQGLACMWPSGLFTRVKFGNRSLKETNANI